jgi:hypothetical protein
MKINFQEGHAEEVMNSREYGPEFGQRYGTYDFNNKPPTMDTSVVYGPTGSSIIDHLITSNDIKNSQTATTGGRKFDGNKLEYGLLPPLALKAVVEILTIGAQKYERDNWKHVPDAKRRYFDAAMRHMWDSKCGEKYDEETNKSHLAHAICNLMFLLEKELLTE